MKHVLLFILLLSSFTSWGQGSLESDRLALLALYNSTNGPGWLRNAGWNPTGNPGDSPCSWYGVTCEGGRVTGLDLSGSAIDGSIPPEIGNLDQLKTFIVDWTMLIDDNPNNPLYKPLPTEIGNLTNLEHLDLSGINSEEPFVGGLPLPGPLPASLGNLTKLTYLDLSCSLLDLQYHGNLNGSIPATLGNLVNLKHLDLGNQILSGPIPPELGNLTQLEYLNLTGSNEFIGGIPASFNNLVNLKTLGLRYNNCCEQYYGTLTGPIPNLSGIPVSANVDISFNAFNFEGLDLNIGRIDWYGYQSNIKLNAAPGSNHTLLTAEAGGTIANNTYKWYRDNTLIATIVGDKNYTATQDGTYHATVTNSAVSDLVLTTEKEVVTVLPVTLVSFSASNEGSQNNLTWKTSFESNSRGFEIERAWNGRNFEKVGFVTGHGNSSTGSDYSFVDNSPLSNSYYRLKQVDFDGKFAYSRVISVKSPNAEIVAYPNPASNHLYLKNLTEKSEIVIRNLEGKVVSKQVVAPGKPLNTSNLTNGIYTIVSSGDVQKVVIQK